jgi:hypothetical protein
MGYLIQQTKASIVLAQNKDEDGHTGQWITIPAQCVRRIRVVVRGNDGSD